MKKQEGLVEPEDKNDLIIALVVIFFFSIFVYQLMFTSKEVKQVDEIAELVQAEKELASSVINEKNKLKSGQYIYSNSDKYKVIRIKAENAYGNHTDSASVIFGLENDEINSVKTIPITSYEEIDSLDNLSKTNDVGNNSLKVEKIKEITKNGVNTIDEAKIEQEQLHEEPIREGSALEKQLLEKHKQEELLIKQGFDCVIIIGVFKRVSNRGRVIDQLISLGYTYSEGLLRDNLNYVGVPIECEMEGKDAVLKELNQVFGIKSWIKEL